MNIVSVEELGKSYADRPLFNAINFGIEQGQRLALVGKNGSGKSTMLKLIAGLVVADEGKVTLRKGTKVGYLPQVPILNLEESILDNIFDRKNEVAAAVLDYEDAVSGRNTTSDLQAIMDKMERLNAWDFEAKAKEVLGKLSIDNTEKKVKVLSGGQRKRVAMAKLLLESPDLLLLDEPTNHLDIEAIEWLEHFLIEQNSAVFLITHDRYFLESVTTEIVELTDGRIYKHSGSYADYLENKETRLEQALTVREKARHLMGKELEWLRRQPQARGTKAKYRIDAFDGIKKEAQKNLEENKIKLSIKATRQGKKIVELHDISHSYGEQKLISHFNHKFAQGEKIGLVGNNGSGKSTLLQIITGRLKPNDGKVVIGETTRFGYYTQETEDLNPANRIIDEIREIAEYIKLSDGTKLSVPAFLEQFLFDRKQQYAYIETLSGGEKRRLQLLKILVSEPNFLILDEPTNDFDIDTLNVLEDYLFHFTGGLIVVSHDRYFLDRLCDHLFVLEGQGHVRDFPGNYTEYRQRRKEEQKNAGSQKKPSTPKADKAKKSDSGDKKLSYNEKREFEQLESDIETREHEKERLLEKLNSGNGDHDQLQEWSSRLGELDAEIDEKTARWLELSERAV